MENNFTIQGKTFTDYTNFIILETYGSTPYFSTFRLGGNSLSGYQVPVGKVLKLKGLWGSWSPTGILCTLLYGSSDVGFNSIIPANPIWELNQISHIRLLNIKPMLIDFNIVANNYPAIRIFNGGAVLITLFGLLEDA
jgi:hypothetical protein